MSLTLEKLQEALWAGLSMVESSLPLDDMDGRRTGLRALIDTLQPRVEGVKPDCPHCKLERHQMDWHPADDRTLCPRCGQGLSVKQSLPEVTG